MNNLIVADVAIRQDSEGRYCLNDLQKAATVGRNPRTVELYEFMRRPETQELISELENTGNSRIKPVNSIRGRNGGTYVVKELVYAYAMWVSPAFNLKVIRAYDELQTNGVAFSDRAVSQVASGELEESQLILKAMELLQTKVAALEGAVAAQAPKVEAYDSYIETKGSYNSTEAAAALGVRNARALNQYMRDIGWKSKAAVDAPTTYAIENGYLVVKARTNGRLGMSFPQTRVTLKGLEALRQLLADDAA